MVHKKLPKPRGRPRAYDAKAALTGARDAFWIQGYAGTSLDVLSDATDMNRPSMYAAFGDKRSLYLQTLDNYIAAGNAAVAKAMDPEHSVAEGLRRLYRSALSTYLEPSESPRGCYLISTATTEAAPDTEVRKKLREALRGFEKAVEARLAQAKTSGDIDAAADPAALAMIASAVLHTIAIRARAGESRVALEAIAETATALICSPNFRS